MVYDNDQLEYIIEGLYNNPAQQAVGYMSFDANGNARKITDTNTFNTMDPSIQSSYLPYTSDGSVINTNGSISKLSPRNFTAQVSKNLLTQIQQKFPQFLSATNQPQPSSTPPTNNTQAQGPKQQTAPMPNTSDVPSWMRGTTQY